MSKFNSWAILSGAASLLAFSLPAIGQEPVSVPPPVTQTAACNTCQNSTGFGYPQDCSSCQGNCVSNYVHECKDRWDHAMRQAAKIEARNDAWPRPFDCADRRNYYSHWETMFQRGFQYQATLTSAHFNEDNELNGLGKSTLAMIMNNMPIGTRNVYILRTGDEVASQERLDHVQDVYQTWYATRNTDTQIAFSDEAPVPGRGNRYETINRSYFDNTPAPVIAVATGLGSTTNIQSGN